MSCDSGYETKSTVSDTWSTDVLASDSEPPEQNQLERLEEVAEEMARQNLLSVGVAEASSGGVSGVEDHIECHHLLIMFYRSPF